MILSTNRSGALPKSLLGIVGVFALLAILFFFARGSVTNGITLFYGIGCPHCEKVEEYLTTNKVAEKVQYTKKEVYYNKRNAKEMASRAKTCGLPTDTIGVPFLWTGSGCLLGEPDIVDFFQKKL